MREEFLVLHHCEFMLSCFSKGDAENARNENTRHENAAPKIRGENGKSET